MTQEPIVCKPLKLAHKFPSLAPLLIKTKASLKKLQDEKDNCDKKLFSLLAYQEAFAALQKEGKNKKLVNLVIQYDDVKFTNYIKALTYIEKKQPRMSKMLVFKIHKLIQSDLKKDPEILGKLRKKQNWIGPEGCKKQDAYFFPPQAKDVPKLMDELFVYLKDSQDDPLIKLAIWFSRFLIIHPFMDGNGRVARLLISVFLKDFKLQNDLYFYPSDYFKNNRLTYFETLYEITESEKIIPWIRFFLKGLIDSSKQEIKNLKLLSATFEDLKKHLGKKSTDELIKKGVIKKTQKLEKFLKTLIKKKIVTRVSKNEAWIALLSISKLNH